MEIILEKYKGKPWSCGLLICCDEAGDYGENRNTRTGGKGNEDLEYVSLRVPITDSGKHEPSAAQLL